MTAFDIDAIADEIGRARAAGLLIEPFSTRFDGFDLDAGYAVAMELNRRSEEAGFLPWGWKGGLTDPAMWGPLSVREPVWGTLWEDRVTSDAGVRVGGLVQPRIEAEIAFGLRDGHLGVDAIEWVALTFEICQCHYPNWSFSAADAVADFCLHELLVVGDRVPVEHLDLAALADVTAVMRCDGQVVAEGGGSRVMNDPLAVVEWMAASRAPEAVPTGRIITTGALAGALPLEPGQRWRVDVDGIDLPPLGLDLE